MVDREAETGFPKFLQSHQGLFRWLFGVPDLDDDLLGGEQRYEIAHQGTMIHVDESQLAFQQPFRAHLEQGRSHDIQPGLVAIGQLCVSGMLR